MSGTLLDIYHRLPYPLRVVAASTRGYQLRQWRYGPETEQLIAMALERDGWDLERWKAWQGERLAYVLYRAATRVPYYRDHWQARRRAGDRASWELLENWPILTKEELRKDPLAFVADDCDTRQMYRDTTGGTTGTPLSIYLKRETVRQWYALYEARLRRWHGVSISDRWAILGGQLVAPFEQKAPPFWVRNIGLNQLYLSTHHLSFQNAKWYVEALRRYAPTHMVVYPSSANVLAAEILKQTLEPPRLKVIFSNAEVLQDQHRQTIGTAFQCRIINTYGMGEIAAAASECVQGAMHIWPEAGFIEIFDDDHTPARAGEVGRLIVTGLLNADMPLVRYEVGDRGVLDASRQICACGKALPLLASIEGRLNDLIVTADGKRIFWLNPVFYGLPIQEAQIIQETLERLRVRFVPAPDYKEQDSKTIVQRLRDRVGDMIILLEQVDSIPRAANGKFRAIVSKVATSA